MEIPKEYELAGQPWETSEDSQLIKEYTVDKLSVLELCKIHKRMPGGIISRLRHLDLVDMRSKARGYLEYENSDLYKEICKNKMLAKEKRKEIKNELQITNNTVEIKQLKEITEMKASINSLKKDVKEILRLMNMLYEFESQD
jgi:hypothetical protein